ncbi:MAG: hypothetical protein KDK36_14500, partial [Leptospiraceae bacterium]|nr:hypothetical protein [Leptospiraceae bacterium]
VNSLGGNWELPKKFAIIIAWPIIHHEKLKRELEVIINEIKIQKNFKNKEELIELFNSFFQNKMKLSKLKQNNLLVTFLKDPKSNMENDLWLAREIFFLYNINSIVLNLETIQSFDSSLVAFFLNWRVYHLKNYPTGYLKLKLGKNPKTFNMFNKLGLTTYFDFI